MSTNEAIEAHYQREGLTEAILAGLREAGVDVDALTVEDLAPVDHFHVRGRESTIGLAEAAGIRADESVLDLGCGIGGPSRHLASEIGCSVTGVDLTPAYCETAAALAERLGLGGLVRYVQGDVTSVPVEDDSFDVAWMQHVTMNVPNLGQLLTEVRRVLKPEGRLAMYELVGEEPEAFPVPWASGAEESFVSPPSELEARLELGGFRIDHWREDTEAAADWFRRLRARVAESGPGPVGLHLLMGEDAPEKIGNLAESLESGRVRVVEVVAPRRA